MSKHAALSSNLVARKGEAAPPADMPTRSAAIEPHVVVEPSVKAKSVPINFKMTDDFVQRFKARAVADRLKLNELLEEAFAAYEREKGRR